MVNFFDGFILNLLTTILIGIIAILLIFHISQYFKLIPVLRQYLLFFKKYLFILFLLPAIFFLFVDYFSPIFKTYPNYELIKDLCKILFSAGIFTTTLNFLDSLDIFKKNFKSIIMSEEFDDLLTKKIDALAYSEEHLNKQNNIEKIWQTVTLCKYRKEFPELYEKLHNKIENLLFKKNHISYYYKNFQISYHFDLEDDKYILMTERTSFTIVRPSKEEFEFDYKTVYDNKDNEAFAKVEFFSKNADEIKFTSIDIKEEKEENNNIVTCSKKMGGHLEYHMESFIKHKQNIDNDRIFSYGSARIIDDLTINLDSTDKINVTFVPLNGNKFYPNGSNVPNRLSYINRDVLLAGEKFIMFFHRNNI
jgi:hypothetical protein